MDEEELIRFHNGDTLHNIPVVRPEPLRSGVPWRVVGAVGGMAALVGSVIGLSFALGDRADKAASSVASSSAPAPVSPAPAPTVTVTRPAVTVAPHQLYTAPLAEQVYVIQTPPTGGDPGTDYCFSYTELGAALLADAPSYECEDFLFSTHPADMQGVFEGSPVDCSSTPGARSAEITFDASTYWGAGRSYTCLLANNGL